MSGGYANNPPPGMGHNRGGGTPQQEWALNNRGEDWARGSPRSGPQNNVENWGVGAVGEGRPSSYSSYSWSTPNERADLGLSSSPHVNGTLDNSDSIRGVDANSFSTSFPALFDKCKRSATLTPSSFGYSYFTFFEVKVTRLSSDLSFCFGI
jgi:hypothetical protein